MGDEDWPLVRGEDDCGALKKQYLCVVSALTI